MKLIDDDHIVIRRVHALPQSLALKRLDRQKDVFRMVRVFPADEKFAEIRIVQHLAEAGPGLLQNFFTVGDEQQCRPALAGLGKVSVVKGGNGCLARPRGGDKEIPPAVAFQPFGLEGV